MRHCWLLASLSLCVPSIASAETLEVDRFEPARNLELLGVQGIDADTGWQPPGADIQVRFEVHADDDVLIEMPGDAVFDWDTGEVYFVGDEDGGVLDVDIGAQLDARFRFDLIGIQYESSFIGPYDLGIFETASFTPYLLPGNADRPVFIDDETTPIEVFNYAIVDAVVASGNFFVDAAFDIEMELSCESIDVTDADGNALGQITGELEAGVVAERDEEVVERLARLHCTLLSDVDLLLYPGVELQIGFQEFQLAPFELRIPLLDQRTDDVDFEPLPIVFDMPPLEEEEEEEGQTSGTSGGVGETGDTDEAGSSGGSGGGEGSESSTGSDSAEPVGSSGMDTDGDGAALDGSADGCGCSSSGGSGAALWLLLGFALYRRREKGCGV